MTCIARGLPDFGDITTCLHSGGNKVSDNEVIPFSLMGGAAGSKFEGSWRGAAVGDKHLE